jgi:O-antigen/teichoic acid export membrane protein
MMPIWVFAILFCPQVIDLVTGGRYSEAAPVCAVLFCAAFVRAQHPFLIRQVQYLRATWVLPLVTTPCAVLSILLTILLARDFGIMAVAWTVLASDTTILVALALAIRRFEHVHYPVGTALGLLSLLVGLAVWVGRGGPQLSGERGMLLKIAIVGVSALAVFAIWIWPRRKLIHQIVSN